MHRDATQDASDGWLRCGAVRLVEYAKKPNNPTAKHLAKSGQTA